MAYRLSATIIGHTGDVRSVCEGEAGQLISASRDRTCRVWHRGADGDYTVRDTLLGHSNYINAVAYMPPGALYPHGLIATGGLDKRILLHQPGLGTSAELDGHSQNVCALAFTPSGLLLSASWDSTAKLWTDNTCIATLKGHAASVICAIPFGPDHILTGSGDKTIKMWDLSGRCVRTFVGHSDAVRALGVVSEAVFASVANDGMMRLWSVDGSCIACIPANNSYIYSMSVLPGENIVTCGEGSEAKVWSLDGQLLQTIHLPCVVIWTVAHCANGDIVFGCDDSTLRVFTRSADRAAAPEVQAAYDEAVAISATAQVSQQVGDLKKDTLPDRKALLTPGKRDGQTLMVNNAGKVEAYQWNAAASNWEFQGEVTDAVDDTLTFDVELENQSMKLRHKKGENPYVSAQKFLTDHELDQMYLDEIANFIIKNANEPVLNYGGSMANPDPFTGSHSFTPGTASPPAAASFARPSMSEGMVGGGADPFTGRAAAAHTAAVASAAASSAHSSAQASLFPHKGLVVFEGGNSTGMFGKLNEFNGNQGAKALSPEAMQLISTALPKLVAREAVDKHTVDLVIQGLRRVLTQWDDAVRFPGLDILRLVCLQAIASSAPIEDLLQSSLNDIKHSQTKSQAINQRIAFRVLCNSIQCNAFVKLHMSEIVETLSQLDVAQIQPQSQLGFSTLLLNVVPIIAANASDVEDEFKCLQALYKIVLVLDINSDAEVVHRTLMALGSLIWPSETLLAAAMSLEGLNSKLKHLTESPSEKVRTCATELLKRVL